MIKKDVIFLGIIMIFIRSLSCFGGGMDYRYEMSELIREIREKAPVDYIVIQQNAVDLYYEEGVLKREWLSRIDGISQESISYGDPGYNDKTPKNYRKFLEKKLKEL